MAKQLVDKGHAYYCYTSAEEIADFRAKIPNVKFKSPWRDGGTPPAGAQPVVRIKAPQTGETIVEDKVQGRVVVQNTELDDMVLLRADGTPTYMLAVVVDDHDMGVTQIIRGDDHLTNSFRQLMIYNAMGWEAPAFAHIPLIHGPDGAKLSKRHGALGVDAFGVSGLVRARACEDESSRAVVLLRAAEWRRHECKSWHFQNGQDHPQLLQAPTGPQRHARSFEAHEPLRCGDAALPTASGGPRPRNIHPILWQKTPPASPLPLSHNPLPPPNTRLITPQP